MVRIAYLRWGCGAYILASATDHGAVKRVIHFCGGASSATTNFAFGASACAARALRAISPSDGFKGGKALGCTMGAGR